MATQPNHAKLSNNDHPMHPPSSMTQHEDANQPNLDLHLSKNTYPRPFFFYGSLMESRTLTNLLGLTSKPELRPAQIVDFKTMLWGPFPALVREAGVTVNGVVYDLQSAEDEASLQRYESSSYAPVTCEIVLGDGGRIDGWTFVWVGERDELEEGVYDFKAWQASEWGGEGEFQ